MNKIVTLLLAVALTPSFAQEIYKPFAVEREAVPRGGSALLEKFIEVNRRMPYSAEVRKIKGATFVSGVVEPNGSVSGLRITRALDPACDQEAIRVLSLFNVWQPALKEGKPVRQEFTYAVKFRPQLTGAEPDKIVAYYNNQRQPITEEAQAAYQVVTPVNSLGYPTDGATVYERKGKGWKEVEKYAFFEKKGIMQEIEVDGGTGTDSIAVKHRFMRLGGRLHGDYHIFSMNDSLQAVKRYDVGKLVGKAKYYYPNGLVKKEEERLEDGNVRVLDWYPNGQISQLIIQEANKGIMTGQIELVNQWDLSGNQLVKDGQGVARLKTREDANSWLVEEGRVVDGKRDSVWVGHLDGRLAYRETHTNGSLLKGISYEANGDSTVYKQSVQNPEFTGGLEAMYRFLGQNMRFPVEASRNGIQGQVVVSFTVCTDGTLCDYEASGVEDASLRKEAVRVVKAMSGKWSPGVRRGKPVRVLFNLPINFQYQ